MGDNKHISQKVKSLYDVLKSNGEDVGSEQEFNDWFLKPGQEGYKNRKYLWDTFNQHGADVGANYEEFAGWLGLRPASQAKKPYGNTFGQSQMPTLSDAVSRKTSSANEWTQRELGIYDTKKDLKRKASKAAKQARNPTKEQAQKFVQQIKDEADYRQATGKGLSDFAKGMPGSDFLTPTLKRNEDGSVVTGDNGEPLVGFSSDETKKAASRYLGEKAAEREEQEAYEAAHTPIKGFGEAFKQGTKMMWEGLKNISAETVNLVTGSNQEYLDAIKHLDLASEYNKSDKYNEYKDSFIHSDEWKNFRDNFIDDDSLLSKLNPVKYGLRALASHIENKALREALEHNNYSISAARKELEEKAMKNESWGDRVKRDVSEAMERQRPTEGFGAWVGNIAPQMVPSAIAMAASVATKNPAYLKAIAATNLGTMAASTAGLSMSEARKHGASDLQAWGVGLLDGGIEMWTEKIPLDRYTKRLLGFNSKAVKKAATEALTNPNSPAKQELQRLLQQARKKLGGKLFAGKNAKEFAGDILAEGLSEFTAEALETITPMIYQNPEEYPTLSEIFMNGLEGAKAGVFMGSVLGSASKGLQYAQNKQRIKQQGYIDVAQVQNSEDPLDASIVEVLGRDNDGGIVVRDGDEVRTVNNSDIQMSHRFTYDEFRKAKVEYDGDSDEALSDAIDDNTAAGYNAADEQAAVDFGAEYNAAKEKAGGTFDDSTLELLDNNPVYALAQMRRDGQYTDDELSAAVEYVNAKAARDGAEQRMADDLDSEIDAARGEVTQRINGDDFMIHGAQMKADNADGTPKRVHIISGNVTTREDGSVDAANSSQTIVVRDAATGKIEMVSPEHIRSVDEAIDPQEEYSNAEAAARAAYEEKKARVQAAADAAAEAEDVADEGNGQQFKGKKEQTEIQQVEDEQGNGQQIKPQTESENLQTEMQAGAESPIVEQTEIPVEKDKKGNVVRTLYHRVPMQRTLEDLYDGSLDQEEIDRFVENLAADAKKRLTSVENEEKPKIGNNKQAYLEAKKRHEEKLVDARAEVEYYDNLQKEVLRVTQRGGRQTGVAEDLGGEPLSLEELAALFASEHKVTPESLKGETGMSGKELKGFVGLVAREENGGVSIERLGELLARSDEWSQLGGTPEMTQEARDMLIDAYMSGNPRSYVKQQRKRFAQKEAEHEMNEIENFAQAAFGISAEEYLAYEEQALPAIINKYAGFDFDIYYAILQEQADARASEAEGNYNNSINESINGQQQESKGNGGSGGILQTEGTADEQGERTSDEQEAGGQGSVGNAGIQGFGTQGNVGEGEQAGTNDGRGSDVYGGGIDAQADGGLEQEITPAIGPFGEIYTQFKGKPQEAITYLLAKKGGEAVGALYHKEIGSIDLVWGKEGTGHSDGFGLAKLAKFHPEVLFNLQNILNDMVVIRRSVNRVQLESDKYKAAIRLTWDNKNKTWLLTMFEKKNSVLDNTTDTGKTHKGNGNDTATPENTVVSAGKVTEKENSVQTSIANAEAETETAPSEAQKKAGNYKKGHLKIDGFDVTIENPKGSVRSGVDADGEKWEQTMNNTYGYIRGTEGVDGDHIDVFLSDDPSQGDVFVVDQVNKDGTFDEHKVMYGFADEESARRAYLANYEEGWQGLGAITHVSKEEFKKWVDSSHRKTKPFAEYKGVKKAEATDNAEASNSTRSAFDNLKKQASDRMLIFKEGGNYEILYEDAKKAAEILELPLQKKDGKTFVSFPIKDLDKNLPLLIRGGVRVAITDELVNTKNQKTGKTEIPGRTEVPGSNAENTAVSVKGSMLSEEESARLSELRARDRKNLERRELEEMLTLERKDRILREGTYYDKPFGLKPAGEISSAEDVEENIAKIIKGLKTNEGDGRFRDFEGFAHGGNYTKNAGRQIDEYLQALIDVIPFDITKAWCESHGLETHDDVFSYGESLYNAEKTEEQNGETHGKKSDRLLYKATTLDAPAITSAEQPIKGGSLSSEGKLRNNPVISQRNGVRNGGVDELVSDATSIDIEDVASFPKEIREEDVISKEQNGGKRRNGIKVKAGLSGNDLYIQYREGRSSKDKRYWATIKIPNATNHSAGQIIYRLGYLGTFTDIERLAGDAVLELFNKNGLRLQKGEAKEVSPREAAMRDALVDVLRGAGVEVVTDAEEGQRVLDAANGGMRLQAKKRALETASLSEDAERSLTVVSSADGAKVLNNLDNLTALLENSATQPKTFVGSVAKELGAQRYNSKSEYAAFKTKSGRVVTIRLADHNTTVSNFDQRGELDGISIVISPKPNQGIINDGNAHIVEYYYDAIKLRRADGKPLADIVRSIKQALYSGEFKDATGIAEVQEVNIPNVRVKLNKRSSTEAERIEKETQLDIINKTNPAPDDYHTWVRTTDDILTLQEAVDEVLREDPSYELSSYPDVSDDVIRDALKTGKITVYSSYPIANGVFVTPSMMQAADYAGGMKVYSKVVSISDVAWLSTDEGQYATTKEDAGSEENEIRFFRTADGHAYGFTVGGKIFIDPRIAGADTPIHEYTHLWAEALRNANPKEWENIVRLMKGTGLWEEVKKKYPELTTDSEIADEVLAYYSGKRGAERLRKEQEEALKNGNGILEKTAAVAAINNVRTALKRFWKSVADFFGVHFNSAEEVADKVLSDMLNGVKPEVAGKTDAALAKEEADIIAKAKADGTYLKAPNGKPTNLTPRQWVQVRTKAFKKWFGDWEKRARIEKLRKSESASITGEEIEITDDYKQNKKNALEYGKRLQGEYTNADTGVSVQLQRGRRNGGIKEVLQHNYKDSAHILSVAAIPQIIEKSVYIESEANNDTAKNPDVVEYQHFVCGLKIGNEDYTVHSLVAVDKHGNRYYDHNLTHIEKTKLLDSIERQAVKGQGFDTTSSTELTTLNGYKGKKLLELLQTNSSKVVDENGEPLVTEAEELARDGRGAYTSDEVSMENDPWSKMAGYNIRSKKERMAFAERERRRMVAAVTELAERLGIAGDVEIVTDLSGLQGRQRRAKGIYRKSSGKITIYIPNHINVADAVATFLHEAVAHKGLRNLFGKHFDEFLDKVYANSESEIRSAIDALAGKKNLSTRTATEEYLAGLAEKTNFEHLPYNGWLQRVKTFFIEMLSKIGIKALDTTTLTDNELRFILWRSYRYMQGKDKGIIAFVEDTAMKMKLGIGYSEKEVVEGAAVANEEEDAGIIDEMNKRFNDALDGLTEENKDRVTLSLGMPSPILIGAGVENKPLKLYGNKVIKKMKKHGFTLDELKDLPRAVADPIAVFDNYQLDGNRTILTELQSKGKNIIVAVTLGKDGVDVDFNIISSIFGKGENNIVDWLNKGYARYINKEKALDYLHHSDRNISEALRNPKLVSAAKIVENFENPKIEGENSEEVDVEADELFREAAEVDKAKAATIYNNRIKSGMYQTYEAMLDSMAGLKEAMMSVLKAEGSSIKYIEDVPDSENAYLGENRLSSVNEAECEAFQRTLFGPLLREVAYIAKTDKERMELTDYMMMKHGLERNTYMRKEAAKKKEETDRDFAGLTTLLGIEDVYEAEAEAQRLVEEYEAGHNTDILWKYVKDVTQATLRKSYECGIISKDTFYKTILMYDYYIPLRGFSDKTSSEEYTYLNHSESSFNAPIRTARGRSSKADDPILQMQLMAESAILQGNRNRFVKQRFLNFAERHPSDLISVRSIWLKYDDALEEWRPVFADINEYDTPEDALRKQEEFDERMEALAESDKEHFKKQSEHPEIPYRVVEKRDLREHQVLVKRGGIDYVLTINGSPRAAQAVNGKTNPDNGGDNAVDRVLEFCGKINRTLSMLYTTASPDFVVGNFARDCIYTNTMVWAKEGVKYAAKFNANYAMLSKPGRMKLLFEKYRKGKLEMSNERERLFLMFIKNGGETGFLRMGDVDQYRDKIKKKLRGASAKIPAGEMIASAATWIGEVGRAVETQARFAAFMTSIQAGRSIGRSIWDAKEISVNFNKKGAGDKFMGGADQTKVGNVSAFTSALGRCLYVFWNAGLQGTFNNFGKTLVRNPKKTTAVMAASFALGLIVSMLGKMAGDDDVDDNGDEEETDTFGYYDISKHTRRQNLVVKIPGTKSWFKLPLPMEFRAMYGMGELAGSTIFGGEPLSAGDMLAQVSQLMPIDAMEGWRASIPSLVKPAADAYVNETWYGTPIYKDTPFNKYLPDWTKAPKNTNKYLVDLAETMNEMTGGDKYSKGKIDMNPARWEYLLRQYGGGIFTVASQLTSLYSVANGSKEADWRYVPLLNRFVMSSGDHKVTPGLNERYFEIMDKLKSDDSRISAIKKDYAIGIEEQKKLIGEVVNDEMYRTLKAFDKEYKVRKKYLDYYQNIGDVENAKNAAREIKELKMRAVEYANKKEKEE